MKERRKIVQEKVLDEDGKLDYVKIPNYKLCNFFMSKYEWDFFYFLNGIIIELNKSSKDIYLDSFPQVAINRIIEQNNKREEELEKDIFAKSIDYVIFNRKTKKILFCIELDGPEHKTDRNRIERDKMINKAFDCCKLTLHRQEIQEQYDKEKYKELIIDEINKQKDALF